MTLMTRFVEGAAATMGVRIVMAWIVGSLIALGTFNHAIVSTIELVFGKRYGADVSYGDLFANLGVSVAGNLVGGLALVTFVRFAQAAAGRRVAFPLLTGHPRAGHELTFSGGLSILRPIRPAARSPPSVACGRRGRTPAGELGLRPGG